MRPLPALLTFTLAAMPLAFAAMPLAFAAQDGATQEATSQDAARPDEAAAPKDTVAPMQAWKRMAGGEWRVTYPDGVKLVQTWNWGPGQHSMVIHSYKEDSLVTPGNGVHLLYWHPGRKEFVLKGLLPGSRYMDGTMSIDGDSAELGFAFHTKEGSHTMSERWTFEGNDTFHETMYYHQDGAVSPIRESDYHRSAELTKLRPRTTEEAAQPSAALELLAKLVGPGWRAQGAWTNGTPFHVISEFAWIPEADAILARAYAPKETAKDGDVDRDHLLDAYFYANPATGSLHYLALSPWGGVYEGDLVRLEDGGIELSLTSFEGDKQMAYVERLDFEADGRLRDQVWVVENGTRRPMLDVRHERMPVDPAPTQPAPSKSGDAPAATPDDSDKR